MRSPKCSRHEHRVQWSPDSGKDVIRPVELIIETSPSIKEGQNRSRSNSGNTILISRELVWCHIEMNYLNFLLKGNITYYN